MKTARETRIETIRHMDWVIRNRVNDEHQIERWLRVGCPDDSTEDDYEWFADDQDEYADLVALFVEIVDMEIAGLNLCF